VLEVDNSDESKNKKTLCAVKNPSIRSNQSWFYNIFLGNISKNKPDHSHIKVNWIMQLNENEINLLKEKSCKVIEIETKIKKSIKTGVEINEL